MTGGTRRGRLAGVGSDVVVVAAAAGLGFLAVGPAGVGVVSALVGVALGVTLRRLRSSTARALAPLPVVVGAGIATVVGPLGVASEFAAAATGLALLLWLADDPSNSPGGVARARSALALPALAVLLAWVSTLVLPMGSGSLGMAAGLLVFVLGAVAFLLSRPRAFDREEAPT